MVKNTIGLDRYTQAQIRKTGMLKSFVFISLGSLILLFLFSLFIVQIFTVQRNQMREIRNHQTNIQAALTCIVRLTADYYLENKNDTSELLNEEKSLEREHSYIFSHFIIPSATKILKTNEKSYNDLIYLLNLIIATKPVYLTDSLETIISDATIYSTGIVNANSIYGAVLEQNNNQQQGFLVLMTILEISIICLLMKFNILPALNSLLDNIFKFIESQENLATEKKLREELVKDLPLHLSDIRVDVAQIGKNLYQVVGQNKTYTVEYRDNQFVCEDSCSVFANVHTCLHTRRAKWFRNKLESSSATMEVFR